MVQPSDERTVSSQRRDKQSEKRWLHHLSHKADGRGPGALAVLGVLFLPPTRAYGEALCNLADNQSSDQPMCVCGIAIHCRTCSPKPTDAVKLTRGDQRAPGPRSTKESTQHDQHLPPRSRPCPKFEREAWCSQTRALPLHATYVLTRTCKVIHARPAAKLSRYGDYAPLIVPSHLTVL
jgi:hypothetical protein